MKRKTKTVGSIGEFLNGKHSRQLNHFEKYGFVYKIVGTTVIILATGGLEYAFAASADAIDVGAEKLYTKLVGIGKWVIIFKGGIDTIKHMSDGNFPEAKKGFLSYLLVYLFLLGLPWAMDEVDKVFKDLRT